MQVLCTVQCATVNHQVSSRQKYDLGPQGTSIYLLSWCIWRRGSLQEPQLVFSFLNLKFIAYILPTYRARDYTVLFNGLQSCAEHAQRLWHACPDITMRDASAWATAVCQPSQLCVSSHFSLVTLHVPAELLQTLACQPYSGLGDSSQPWAMGCASDSCLCSYCLYASLKVNFMCPQSCFRLWHACLRASTAETSPADGAKVFRRRCWRSMKS